MTGDATRTTSGGPSSRTCSSRSAAERRSTAASPSGAATTRASCSRRTSGERFPLDRDAVERAGELAERLEFDLTRGPRLPLPRLLRQRRAGERPAQTRLRPRVRRALCRCERPQAQGAGAARRGARADRRARARRLLPAPLGGARARPRVRARGARRVGRAEHPASGPRSRKLGRLDRLLPDWALARRPGAGGPAARPLPQPGARLGAGHRPRLPARHPREADRRGLRALRPRALRSRRELLDVPRARGDPRRRQGARAAVRRARAAGAADRREPVPRRRGAREAARRRLEACVAALARVRAALPASSAACRATSRSTRAGW